MPASGPVFAGTVTIGTRTLTQSTDSYGDTTYAPIASPTFTGTVGGITAAMVGLGNVTNTSDANKPVSTAQQTALNLKANLSAPAFTGNVQTSGTTPTMAVFDNSGLGAGKGGEVLLQHVNANTAQTTYASVKGNAVGGAAGSEAGNLLLKVMRSGSLVAGATITYDGGIQLLGITQPACDATHGGVINYAGHTTNVKDTVAVCAADGSNVYAWRTIY